MKPDIIIAFIEISAIFFHLFSLRSYFRLKRLLKLSKILKFWEQGDSPKLISLVRLITIKVNSEINHFVKNKTAPFRKVLLAVSATNHFSSKDVYWQITFSPNFKFFKSEKTIILPFSVIRWSVFPPLTNQCLFFG